MPYEYIASSAFPRLLILLTDELEGSVKLVNILINQTIQINFDGDAPKNRCFISVIGYNQNVKELCSGWLKDLDANPLRYETVRKKISDGAGGILECETKQPIWVKSTKTLSSTSLYADAVLLSIELSQKWSKDNYMAPIVIDCSEESHGYCAKERIEQLKEITSKDGNVLFFGCYSKNEDISRLFSNMPEEWGYKFQRWGLEERDYINGLFYREHIGSIFSAMMETGGMAVFTNYF